MTTDTAVPRNCRFICLIGMDGTGKSTLAHSVMDALEGQGVQFQYVHGLMQGRLSSPLMALGRLLFARGRSREANYEAFVTAKRRSVGNWPTLYSLYRAAVLLDYAPQVASKIAVPLALGGRVICDRYVYDTVINLELNTHYDGDRAIRAIQHLFRVFPTPDLTFLVDVPEEVAFARKDDVPGIRHLRERRKAYQQVAKVFKIRKLDGTRPIGALTSSVVEAVSSIGGS